MCAGSRRLEAATEPERSRKKKYLIAIEVMRMRRRIEGTLRVCSAIFSWRQGGTMT